MGDMILWIIWGRKTCHRVGPRFDAAGKAHPLDSGAGLGRSGVLRSYHPPTGTARVTMAKLDDLPAELIRKIIDQIIYDREYDPYGTGAAHHHHALDHNEIGPKSNPQKPRPHLDHRDYNGSSYLPFFYPKSYHWIDPRKHHRKKPEKKKPKKIKPGKKPGKKPVPVSVKLLYQQFILH
jgi:hypothetical protein